MDKHNETWIEIPISQKKKKRMIEFQVAEESPL
jgi:hypothetical protein